MKANAPTQRVPWVPCPGARCTVRPADPRDGEPFEGYIEPTFDWVWWWVRTPEGELTGGWADSEILPPAPEGLSMGVDMAYQIWIVRGSTQRPITLPPMSDKSARYHCGFLNAQAEQENAARTNPDGPLYVEGYEPYRYEIRPVN